MKFLVGLLNNWVYKASELLPYFLGYAMQPKHVKKKAEVLLQMLKTSSRFQLVSRLGIILSFSHSNIMFTFMLLIIF